MTTARDYLLDLIENPDAYDQPKAEIDALQLEAARALFADMQGRVQLLRRRAEDVGVTEIRRLDDLVPLLLAHTAYKSYPAPFVEKKQWRRLLDWLQTMSTATVTDVDLDGVDNVDDWIDRLRANGHHILATSGTSGKCSFLNHTEQDFALKRRHWAHTLGWPYTKPDGAHLFFALGPSIGPNSAIEAMQLSAGLWAAPGDSWFLTDQPLLLSEVSAMAAMRKRMADGSATPSEIQAFETNAGQRGAQMREALQSFADRILEHRHQPIVLSGLWAQHLQIIERARALGIGDGEFHPESVISAGGGIKGVALPPDYKEQVSRFYGKVIRPGAYGMTELFQMLPRCEAMRYHRPPGLIILPLDAPGERLLTEADGQDGIVEGRAGFLDLLIDGRWGGLITGDKIQMDLKDRCPCGRSGPTILDTISRFSEGGKDDHIGCAGTIDSYVRGMVAA